MTLTSKRIISLGLALFLLAGFASLGLAQESSSSATATISQGLENTASGTYSSSLTLTAFIGNLIQALLTATGIVFLVITVLGGISYMIANGDDTKIKKAKGMIVNALVGLVIIVGAYALTSYVVSALSEASTASSTTTS
ncbi:hypothetical protein HY631_02500 [Candidatus Uhrbacteria bacterium]|nr:hypothetical protein [Candidatus Uhrbacteria bacterium]